MNKIEHSLKKLTAYIESENYRGWDPYDLLSSPIFKLPVLRSNKTIRFIAQQSGKRFPINLRSLLFVPKGLNPVTLGLCLQGYCYLIQNCQPQNRHPEQSRKVVEGSTINTQHSEIKNKIDFIIRELEKLISPYFSGACWGYNFDWEARNAKIPAYQPTVVATGIIVNALYTCYKETGNEKAKELVLSAANFVLNDLNRTYTNDKLCFSYSPFDKQKVLNASMKGVRILAQAYSLNRNEELRQIARSALGYIIEKQNSDGSWGYSDKKTERVDSYHTGYVLDCLDDYTKLTNDFNYKNNLTNGISYFVNNLVEDKRVPKFYNNNKYPIDCTSAAQIILTLIRFNYEEIARDVAEYIIDEMQDTKGYFYFRRFKSHKIKSSFMRWSNAWMFLALSSLLKNSGD